MLRSIAAFAVPLLVGIAVSVGGYHSSLLADACFALAAAVALVALIAETPWGKRWEWLQRFSGLRSSGSTSGLPLTAPVRYQIRQLRQVIRKLAESQAGFDYGMLIGILNKHPRRGIDPVFEPLHGATTGEALAALVTEGVIEPNRSDKAYYFTILRPSGRRPTLAARGVAWLGRAWHR